MNQLLKNDAAWEKLFAKHNILEEIRITGIFKISATQINEFREARLMTKFDHKVNLPQIFRDNGLSILPDSRGTYLIGQFDLYQHVPSDYLIEPDEFQLPPHIETIDYTNLYSEVSALLCAYNAGIISDVVGEDVSLTVMGRMSTLRFSYRVRDERNGGWYSIEVNNAQCEIDGGFEGETKFILIEAKNYIIDDFLIRQLYYPYRLWATKTLKDVVPIFLSYSNDVFTFFTYRFQDKSDYNSIELVDRKCYQIAPERIELSDIYSVFKTTFIQPEPQPIPFPQADNFRRIIDLLGLLYTNDLSQQDITLKYQFDRRQTQYYSNSCIYLDLVRKCEGDNRSVIYTLTDLGKSILEMPAKKKYLTIVSLILRHEVFYKTIEQYFERGARPTKMQVVEIMQTASLNFGSGTTVSRRSQTVLAWVDWILSLSRTML